MIDARRVEEAGLNALQTQRQLFYDGWLLRVSPGKAKRARSVNAHFGSSLPLAAKIAHCERIYRERELPTLFRITPFVAPADLERALEARGYAPFETTLVQAVELDGTALPVPARGAVELVDATVDAFVDAVATLRGSSALQRDAHRERLGHSPLDGRHVLRARRRRPGGGRQDGARGRHRRRVRRRDGRAGARTRHRDAARRATARASLGSRRARRVPAGRRRQRRRRSRSTAGSDSRRSTPTTTADGRANAMTSDAEGR